MTAVTAVTAVFKKNIFFVMNVCPMSFHVCFMEYISGASWRASVCPMSFHFYFMEYTTSMIFLPISSASCIVSASL